MTTEREDFEAWKIAKDYGFEPRAGGKFGKQSESATTKCFAFACKNGKTNILVKFDSSAWEPSE